MATAKDWARLASATRERRVELGLTQEDVRAAGGPATATMRLIEGALQDGYQLSTLRDLEKVLRWEHGSAAAILAGGDPKPLDELPEPEHTTRTRITAALAGGPELEQYVAIVKMEHKAGIPPRSPGEQRIWDSRRYGDDEKAHVIAMIRQMDDDYRQSERSAGLDPPRLAVAGNSPDGTG